MRRYSRLGKHPKATPFSKTFFAISIYELVSSMASLGSCVRLRHLKAFAASIPFECRREHAMIQTCEPQVWNKVLLSIIKQREETATQS